MVSNQAYLFLIFVINGIIIGLVFDAFRILRKSFKTSDLITIIQDILFWIITGTIILYSIFVFNDGEIRFFMFVAIFLGVALYMRLLSQYIIKISVGVIDIVKKAIKFVFKILAFPIKIISKTIKKPILFCFINVKKIIRQIISKTTKINIKKQKNRGKIKTKVE